MTDWDTSAAELGLFVGEEIAVFFRKPDRQAVESNPKTDRKHYEQTHGQ